LWGNIFVVGFGSVQVACAEAYRKILVACHFTDTLQTEKKQKIF
jgi:hypothetical protein